MNWTSCLKFWCYDCHTEVIRVLPAGGDLLDLGVFYCECVGEEE